MRPVKKGIMDLVESFVRACPNELCLYSETESYSTKEMYQKIKAIAAFLREKGVGMGDYIGISATRSIKTILVFFATQFLGAVAAMFDPHAPIEKCKEELGVDIPLKFIMDSTGDGFTINGEIIDFDGLNGEIDRPSVDVHAPAVVIFTSGSTGISKGVLLSQYSYVNHQRNYAPVGGFTVNESAMQLLPFSHVFGIAQIVDAMLHHCSTFFPKVVTPEYVLQCIEKYGFTRFGFVPSFALMMADVKREKGYNTDSLRTVILAGAPTSFEQFLYIQDTLGMKIVPAYGMTELASIAGAAPEESDEKRAGSVGKPLPMTRVKIDEDGEILVKGPSIFLGYYGEEPINRRKFFPTGDLGYIDDEGFLHITGRKKDIIIRNGHNLSPLEIEQKLLKLPFVKGAAVVGVKDDKCGEVPVAIIVPDKGKEYDEAAIKSVLNKLEMPKEIRILDKMPLTAAGKTDKMKIKEMFRA